MAEPTLGLRERKKVKTRLAIKAEAFQLFQKHGYEATTVEQIAEATEISPSTFFRYFPTKESVLIENQYPIEIVERFDQQPEKLGLVDAMHAAVTEIFAELPSDELAALRKRNQLIMSTPDLRAAYMEHLFGLMTMIASKAARRSNGSEDSLEIRTFAWVMQGVLTAASTQWTENSDITIIEAFDRAFAVIAEISVRK
ncbi:TetR family transcriptional regulator [Aeromicrobium panaciterrae]|uniref:acyl-CoA-like ligand-binding transcription factor n=1 Tax=Aeromicrobium panaciterrae TaxID=363861 RepID=UPI0031D2D019